MRAYVGDLLTAGAARTVAFCERLEPPSDEVTLEGPVRGQFVLRGTGETVLVHGRVSATAGLICGACLERFSQALEVDVDEEFGHRTLRADRDTAGGGGESVRPAAQMTRSGSGRGNDANEQALGPDDFVAPMGPDDLIDLTELVRQHLALAVPIAPRCSPGCRGLCPRCGADRNSGACNCEIDEIDPRFEELRRWAGDRASPAAKKTQTRGAGRPHREGSDQWD